MMCKEEGQSINVICLRSKFVKKLQAKFLYGLWDGTGITKGLVFGDRKNKYFWRCIYLALKLSLWKEINDISFKKDIGGCRIWGKVKIWLQFGFHLLNISRV